MEFRGLADKFSPTIKRIAYKLNGRFRSFDHDDLYQEALLHLWQDYNCGKLSDKTDSYILQGCYFHLKNCIRKINEKPNMVSFESLLDKQENSKLEDVLFNKYAFQPDTRQELDDKLIAGSIQNNGFSPKEKQVISFLADGSTTRQIGARIGVSHVSVVKMIKKIRKKSFQHMDKI